MSLDEFVALVGRETTEPADDIRRVLDAVRAEQDDPDFDDDISLLVLRFA